jgi:hypothetical protein
MKTIEWDSDRPEPISPLPAIPKPAESGRPLFCLLLLGYPPVNCSNPIHLGPTNNTQKFYQILAIKLILQVEGCLDEKLLYPS